MYDFVLNAGDTIIPAKYDYEACDSISPFIIDSVIVENHQGISLKHQFVSTTLYYKPEWGCEPAKESNELIEKIGCAYNFIFQPSCVIKDIFGVTNSLRCYIDDELHYKNDWWDSDNCDVMITGVADLKNRNLVSAYPSVSNKIVTFSCTSGTYFYAIIYELTGNVVTRFNGEFPYRADISSLKPGIYFTKFYSNNYLSSLKIIKK